MDSSFRICAATIILGTLLFIVYRKLRSNPQIETVASSPNFSTPSSDLEAVSNGSPLQHAVYIYCAETLRNTFASHLSVDFRRKRIAAFVNCDDDDVTEGASVVFVFSKNDSCFDKLVTVLQCRRKTGLLVVPVFYGVSPSEVVVPEHDSGDRIREWSRALRELRELPSHQSRYPKCFYINYF